MKIALEHIGLATQDPSSLKDWYNRVLGAECIFDNGETPPAFLIRLPGGMLLEIYPGQTQRPETSDNLLSGWRHLALQVDSIEDARKELTERGVEFTDPVKLAGGGGRVLFFQDPEGNLLHLVERPQGSPFRL